MCTWRIEKDNKILLGSRDDDGEKIQSLLSKINGGKITSFLIDKTTADIELKFEEGLNLKSFISSCEYEQWILYLYSSKLKNWFLASSALPHIFRPRSRLAYWQWSLAPVGKSEEPPGKITNF